MFDFDGKKETPSSVEGGFSPSSGRFSVPRARCPAGAILFFPWLTRYIPMENGPNLSFSLRSSSREVRSFPMKADRTRLQRFFLYSHSSDL
ncbi:hypothetical protein B4135_3473 [Caldibacillus debilis]|uniref:Uncharacterized protein n=1 Tax=Caldibacillus debilis TaxID=301148 RepID=A0A150LD86_9BACI|nr:hypothetical protein B4135_3473 [Caldibacillus debilis]